VDEHRLTGVRDAGAFLARLTRLDPTSVVRLRSVDRHSGHSGAARSGRASGSRVQLWARLPWTVLVTRAVTGSGPGDATVSAADLLAELGRGGGALPSRRDADWRWPLPPSVGRAVETISGTDLRVIAAAAASTLRGAEAGGVAGRAVGQRALRDALLDHVAVVVTATPAEAPPTDPARSPGADGAGPDGAGPDGAGSDGAGPGVQVEVSQRLVQAVVRMGFLGRDGTGEGDYVQIRLAGRWIGIAAPFGTAWSLKATRLPLRPIGVHPNR
jgi:hypothetical protein